MVMRFFLFFFGEFIFCLLNSTDFILFLHVFTFVKYEKSTRFQLIRTGNDLIIIFDNTVEKYCALRAMFSCSARRRAPEVKICCF